MKIPLKEFFKNRPKGSFYLSPDNTKVAYLDTYKERRNIHVMDLETSEVEVITTQQRRNIESFSWKNNDTLLYLQDNNGDENDHVFLIDLATKKEKDITPGERLKVAGINPLNNKVYLDGKTEYTNKILISHNERIESTFDKYIYDIKTGERELIEEFQPGESAALSDEDTFKSIYKFVMDSGGGSYFKDGKAIKFVSSKDEFTILDFTSKDKNELYVMSNEGRDKTALFKADLNLNIIGDVVFESDKVDLSSAILDYYTNELKVVTYIEEKTEAHYFDKKLEAKHKEWKEAFVKEFPNEAKSTMIAAAILGTDEQIVEFNTYGDNKLSDEYYWFRNKNKFVKLTDDEKLLNTDNLVEMKPISYKARDGLTIYGYLTLPKDVKGPVPIIVNPHGGPWVRDVWGYNPEVQYFANKGFGVFQPNFRISTGYGKEHFTKGWMQWGLDCQHDVTDGTNWLIEQGYTKKGMIAIYGGSYGGYATLMGIINEPDLYSAAVDYCGVSDLFTFWDGFPEYWKYKGNIFEEAMGDPYKDRKHYESISPVYRAKEIKTPLFVVQGAQDPRVPVQQAEQIVDALKSNDVAVKYMVKEDEGHGFANQENRFELYEEMTKFFDEHLNR